MGDLSGPALSTRKRGGTDSFSSKTPFESRDARMVSGFDLIGHNRTFQIHWAKRVVAFFLDLTIIFAPLWSFLYLAGVRQTWIYGVLGGFLLYAYSTAMEAAARCTLGKFILGLEVRSLRGPMTPRHARRPRRRRRPAAAVVRQDPRHDGRPVAPDRRPRPPPRRGRHGRALEAARHGYIASSG